MNISGLKVSNAERLVSTNTIESVHVHHIPATSVEVAEMARCEEGQTQNPPLKPNHDEEFLSPIVGF